MINVKHFGDHAVLTEKSIKFSYTAVAILEQRPAS